MVRYIYTEQATPMTNGAGYVIKTVELTLGHFTTASSYRTSQGQGSMKPTMHSKGVAPLLLNYSIFFSIIRLNLLNPRV